MIGPATFCLSTIPLGFSFPPNVKEIEGDNLKKELIAVKNK